MIERYVSAGLHVVPWQNRTVENRRPIWKGWTSEKAPSVESIRQAVLEYPKADWAIVPKAGFMVIDLDRKNGHDGIASFAAWCETNGTTIEEVTKSCPMVETFHKGLHIYFGYAGDLKTRILSPGVEAKHGNASVHVPPSEGYTWINEIETIQAIPQIPKWLLAKWQEHVENEASGIVDKKIFSNGERRISLCGMAGVLRNAGLRGNELKQSLRAVAKERCEGDFPVDEVDQIADDYSKKDGFNLVESALNGDKLSASILNLAAGNKFHVAPEYVAARAEEAEAEVTKLTHEELHPTEMLGTLVDWADACNWTHQPELTLLGMCTAVGTIMGRNYRMDSLFPNLYSLCLVESSSGKDMIKQSITKLFLDCGFEDLLGGGSFGSDAGLITELRTKPTILWVTDEMQGFIQNASNPKAAAYMVNIESMLLEIYNCGDYRVKSLKNAEGEVLKNMCPNIVGMSQPGRFWKAFNEHFIESGFIGRFVIFNGRPFPRLDENAKVLADCPVPANVKTMFESFLSTGSVVLRNRTHSSNPDPITWENEDAKQYNSKLLNEWQDLRQELLKQGNGAYCTIMGRDYEKAKRFMAIYAWSANPAAPRVGRDAIKWGWAMVKHADDCVKYGLRTKYSTNDDESTLKKFHDVIFAAGPDGIDMMTLRTKTQWAHKTRDKLIEELLESNQISLELSKAGKGRPKRTYRSTRYKKEESHAQ